MRRGRMHLRLRREVTHADARATGRDMQNDRERGAL
jgi:hypothetical protein